MRAWKDVTSYSRNGDKTPHWWELWLGSLRISVGNMHVYFPKGDTWLMNCAPWFDTHQLSAKDEQTAKADAIELVRAKLEQAIEAIRAL